MVAGEGGRMMSMFRTMLIHDHDRRHRGGGTDRTAIQGLLRGRRLADEVRQQGARQERGEEVQATALIVATAEAEVGRGLAREVGGGMGGDENVT